MKKASLVLLLFGLSCNHSNKKVVSPNYIDSQTYFVGEWEFNSGIFVNGFEPFRVSFLKSGKAVFPKLSFQEEKYWKFDSDNQELTIYNPVEVYSIKERSDKTFKAVRKTDNNVLVFKKVSD